jgi:hypothetical protein
MISVLDTAHQVELVRTPPRFGDFDADIHRVNLTTGQGTMVALNLGDVLHWITDVDGAMRARITRRADGVQSIERWNAEAERWERVATLGFEEAAVPVGFGFTRDRRGVWLLSNRGRDRRVLVRLDLATGVETVGYEHPVADVADAVVSEVTGQPLFALAEPGLPEVRVFDPALAVEVAALRVGQPFRGSPAQRR